MAVRITEHLDKNEKYVHRDHNYDVQDKMLCMRSKK